MLELTPDTLDKFGKAAKYKRYIQTYDWPKKCFEKNECFEHKRSAAVRWGARRVCHPLDPLVRYNVKLSFSQFL